jgi:hypothetical protein
MEPRNELRIGVPRSDGVGGVTYGNRTRVAAHLSDGKSRSSNLRLLTWIKLFHSPLFLSLLRPLNHPRRRSFPTVSVDPVR